MMTITPDLAASPLCPEDPPSSHARRSAVLDNHQVVSLPLTPPGSPPRPHKSTAAEHTRACARTRTEGKQKAAGLRALGEGRADPSWRG